MFSRAVISFFVGLFLACISDSLPSQISPFAKVACYVTLGFALVSALLSLFEEAEESPAGELEDVREVVRQKH